jgi:hypothetical protein
MKTLSTLNQTQCKIWLSWILGSCLVLSGLSGCGEEPCTAGTQCASSCPNGYVPVCVVDGICECVVYGTEGGSTNTGGTGITGSTGGSSTTGGTTEPLEIPMCNPPLPGDLILNEVLVDPSNAEPQNEFIELINTSDQEVDLQGLYINYNQELKFEFLSGCMAPKSAVALYHEQALTVWSTPARLPTWTVNTGRVFTNSADFNLGLYQRDDPNPLSTLYGPKSLVKAGVSATRLDEGLGDEAVRHTDVSTQDQSPSLCSNGGRFENECLDGNQSQMGGNSAGGQEAGQMGANTTGGQEGGQMGANMMGGQNGGGGPVPVNCLPPQPDDIFVNEVLINPEGNESSSGLQNEFIELANRTSMPLNLGGVSLYYNDELKFIFPEGCFAGQSLVALFNQKASVEWIWSSSASDKDRFDLASVPSFTLRNSGITIELKTFDNQTITRFNSDEIQQGNPTAEVISGQSLTRAVDGDSNAVFILHPPLLDQAFSPGTCRNGHLYETGCAP